MSVVEPRPTGPASHNAGHPVRPTVEPQPVMTEKRSMFFRRKPATTQPQMHGGYGHANGSGHDETYAGTGYAVNGPYGHGFKFGRWIK